MSVRFSTVISLGGKRVEHPPREMSAAHQKANSVFCPLGPAPTTAWIVMQKGHLDSLSTSSAHDLSWKILETTADSASGITETEFLFPGLYIRHAERLFPGAVGFAGGLHLVELVDSRYLASKLTETGDLIANLRTKAHSEDFLAGTTNLDTWTKFLTELWNKSTFLGSWPGLPLGLPIDGKPTDKWEVGKNAYYALNEILNRLDCAIQHDPLSNLYSIVQLGTPQIIPANSNTLKFNSEPKTGTLGVPAQLAIYRMIRRKGYGQERDAERENNWSVTDFYETNLVGTNLQSGLGKQPIWDDLPVIWNESGDVSNQADITTRNSNIQSRFTTRFSVEPKHRVHYGLLSDYLPGGEIRATLWRNWGMEDAEENWLGGTVTEFMAGTDLIIGYSAGESASTFHSITPHNEAYSPPDFARNTFPLYPRLSNIVQVWSTEEDIEVGTGVDPIGQYSMHRGRVKRWVNNSMQTLEDCWILFVDNFDIKQGSVKAKHGAYYGPARLSGITTNNGETLPVYVVFTGADIVPEEVSEFELTQDIFLGGTATAITIPGAVPIIVVDVFSQNGCWQAYIGSKGFAVMLDAGDTNTPPTYAILFMERPTLLLEGSVPTDRDTNSFSFVASIILGFQQGGKLTPDELGQTQAEVFDSHFIYPKVLKGAIGLAVWNDVRARREALVYQQQCLYASCKIQQGLVPSQTADVSIHSFQPMSFSPFNLKPDPPPQAVHNSYHLGGMPDDEAIVMWDDFTKRWEIILTDQDTIRPKLLVVDHPQGGGLVTGDVSLNQFSGRSINDSGIAGQPCIIQFMDYEELINLYVYVARNRKIYGPGVWSGFLNVGGGTPKPIYRCAIGEQRWYGKREFFGAADLPKGGTGDFILWFQGAATAIQKSATCHFGPYKVGKYAVIEMMNGEIIANQVEFDKEDITVATDFRLNGLNYELKTRVITAEFAGEESWEEKVEGTNCPEE